MKHERNPQIPPEILCPVVDAPQRRPQGFSCRPGIFLHLWQRYRVPEESPEPLRLGETERFRLQVGIHHPHQGRSLPRKILQRKQRQTGHPGGSHDGFRLLPISDQRQFSAGLHHLIPEGKQSLLFRLLPDHPVVHRLRHAAECRHLTEIRQHFILSDFKRKHRLRKSLPQGGHALPVIGPGGRIGIIQISLDSGFSVRVFLVLRRADGPHLPFSEILRRIEIAFRIAAFRAVESVGSPGIQPVRQRFFGASHQLRHAFLSFFVAAQFISQRQHHKGRMLSEHPKNFRQFFPIILKGHIAFKGVRRIPVGKLRLHQHPDPVRCRKGRLRRAVGMKPHAVHAVGLIAPQHLFPFPFCHGRMPRFRPGGAVGLAPQEDSLPVQAKAVFTVRKESPEAGQKDRFVRFTRMAVRLQSNPDGIELRIFHLPFSNIFRQRNPRNTDCPDTSG